MTFTNLYELDCLRSNPNLSALLSHYAVCAEDDLEAWHDRLKQLDDVEPAQMAKLHGELIAFGWVEQNTGTVPARYRITLDGWRATKQVEWREGDAVAPRIAPPRYPRKKRRKSEPSTPPPGTAESVAS